MERISERCGYVLALALATPGGKPPDVARLREALSKLPPSDADFLGLKYPDGVEPHSFDEIRRIYRVTRERARQMDDRILTKLRRILDMIPEATS